MTALLGVLMLITLTPGCQLLAELLGETSVETTQSALCKQAEACCVGLLEATAYNEVIARAEVRDWPNHCPSWNVRSEQECQSFLTTVEQQRETISKEHPVYEPGSCR